MKTAKKQPKEFEVNLTGSFEVVCTVEAKSEKEALQGVQKRLQELGVEPFEVFVHRVEWSQVDES